MTTLQSKITDSIFKGASELSDAPFHFSYKMAKNYQVSDIDKEYKDLMFRSWEEVKDFMMIFLPIILILGGLWFWLYDCSKFVIVILFIITFPFIFMLIICPYHIYILPQYLRKKHLAEKNEKELKEYRDKREKEIKDKYPHAYSLTTKSISFSSGEYDDISAYKQRFSSNNKKFIFDIDITDEEWIKREEAAIRAMENIRIREELAYFIGKYPLAFYKFCSEECHATFGTKHTYSDMHILLPGVRSPEKFKTYKKDLFPTQYTEGVMGSYRWGIIYYGTNSSFFPPISSKSLKKVYENLKTIDEEALRQQQEVLKQQLQDEDILINYNYKIYNVRDRDKYVDDFLKYMGVTENKMEFVLANLEGLDGFVSLQKTKENKERPA